MPAKRKNHLKLAMNKLLKNGMKSKEDIIMEESGKYNVYYNKSEEKLYVEHKRNKENDVLFFADFDKEIAAISGVIKDQNILDDLNEVLPVYSLVRIRAIIGKNKQGEQVSELKRSASYPDTMKGSVQKFIDYLADTSPIESSQEEIEKIIEEVNSRI